MSNDRWGGVSEPAGGKAARISCVRIVRTYKKVFEALGVATLRQYYWAATANCLTRETMSINALAVGSNIPSQYFFCAFESLTRPS